MKPQDRNVNTVCLPSQEPVALSTFDACFGLLAVILCLLMLMRVRLLMWQHSDTKHISLDAPSLLDFSSLLHGLYILAFFKSHFVSKLTESWKPPSTITTRNVFSWHRMAAFTSYLSEASCTISIPSYITQTRRQISLRRQQYIAQMSVATTSAKHQICVDI